MSRMRQIYHDKNLQFPDQFDSTFTLPPIHYMQYVSYTIEARSRTNYSRVEASDNVDVDDLKSVHVPPGLNVDIIDFDDE